MFLCVFVSSVLLQPGWTQEIVWNFYKDVCRPTQQGTAGTPLLAGHIFLARTQYHAWNLYE